MGNIQNSPNNQNQNKLDYKTSIIFNKLSSIKLFFTKRNKFFNVIYDPLNDSSNDEMVINLNENF